MDNRTNVKQAAVIWHVLFWLALLGIGISFVVGVRSIIGYFALAGALAYVLYPAVAWLEKRKIPLWAATLISFAIFGGIVALLLVLIIPPTIKQFNDLTNNIPQYFETIKGLWERFGALAQANDLPVDIQTLPQKLAENLQKVAGSVGTRAFNSITGFFGTLASLVIVPILLYYFLSDGPYIKESFLKAVPVKYKGTVTELLRRMNDALGGFIRGQLKLCLAMGVLTFVATAPVMFKYSLIFGLIAGITEFIPYVGPILALIGPLIYASFTSWGLVLYVLIIFIILQILEGNFLAPRIMGNDVGLHPALIIFILMCGGQIGGLVGMIAAIPTAVVLKVFYQYFYEEKYLGVEKSTVDTGQSGLVRDDSDETVPKPSKE
ncbi:MAG TPA: AI-2E family transporter [bacterium]|nr:AI-2E family transporter [bacterium]